MKITRMKLLGLAGLITLLLSLGVGAGLWFVFLNDSSEEERAQHRTEQYFSHAVEGNLDLTYDLLAAEPKASMSRQEWHARNEESLALTGPLREANVLSIDILAPDEAYATVELRFGEDEALPVVIPLIKEDGEWKIMLSVGDDAGGGWQEVGPDGEPMSEDQQPEGGSE